MCINVRRTDKHTQSKNAVNVLKDRKAVKIDEITGKMIKNGGECVIEWVYRR